MYNEEASAFADVNAPKAFLDELEERLLTSPEASMADLDVEAALQRHAVNGFVFCNLPGLALRQGQRVRWHVAAVGSEESVHTAHWHGLEGLSGDGHATDSLILMVRTSEELKY